MSMTISRGYHYADKYTVTAACIGEYFYLQLLGKRDFPLPQVQLRVSQMFLDNVKYAIAVDKDKSAYDETRSYMEALCALGIANKTLTRMKEIQEQEWDLSILERKIHKLGDILEKTKKGKKIPKREMKYMQDFFDQLIWQGQHVVKDHPFDLMDDDD